MNSRAQLRLLLAMTLALTLFLFFTQVYSRASANAQTSSERDKSILAFRAVASVVLSPRCANCHVSGDAPLQGDDSHLHPMNVKRGVDGRGSPSLRCSACHQTENASFLHGPPGAADWRLPPAKTRLPWKDMTIGELCRALKDPLKNGGRSVKDAIPYMEENPLVRWSYNPGPGRSVPPISYDEFVSSLKEWIDTGAACPEK